MTMPVLTFRPRGLASEVALLGRIVAAEIIPCGNRATWVMRLNCAPFKSGPSSSFAMARRKIEHEVREWLIAADLYDAAMSMLVRVEERQRERA